MTADVETAWRTSAPHAALLAKFRSPRPRSDFGKAYRMPALREPVRVAVTRFAQQGFIRPSPVEEKLVALRAADLKAALRGSGLKVSGRKPELIARLIAEAPKVAKALAKELPKTHGLTEQGREIVDRYLTWEKQRVDAAIADVAAFLRLGDIDAAVRRHAVFHELDVWADPDEPYRLEQHRDFLKRVATARPGILGGIGEPELDQLRMATALTHFFGRDAAAALPVGYAAGSHLDEETAARMMLFYVSRTQDRDRMFEHPDWYSRIEISGSGDERTCEACRQLGSRDYSLENLPELPYPGCTSQMGCRCIEIARPRLGLGGRA